MIWPPSWHENHDHLQILHYTCNVVIINKREEVTYIASSKSRDYKKCIQIFIAQSTERYGSNSSKSASEDLHKHREALMTTCKSLSDSGRLAKNSDCMIRVDSN